MDKVLRETAVALECAVAGIPWSWNVPDGAWTYDLYRSLPQGQGQYEVIGGRLVMNPSPRWRHQQVLRNLVLIVYSIAIRRGRP